MSVATGTVYVERFLVTQFLLSRAVQETAVFSAPFSLAISNVRTANIARPQIGSVAICLVQWCMRRCGLDWDGKRFLPSNDNLHRVRALHRANNIRIKPEVHKMPNVC